MREFQEKKKFQKIIYSKGVLFALLCLLIFLTYSSIRIYSKSRNAVSKEEEIQKELTEMQKKKSDLEEKIKQLESGPGLEEEMRKNFNVSKPGEKTLVIVDKNNENDKINSGENQSGFFSRLWKWIKKVF